MKRWVAVGGVVVLSLAFLAIEPAAAQITAAQRKEIDAINAAISKAGQLFVQEKFGDSGESLKTVQQQIEKLAESGNADVLAALEPAHKRLAKAHALLELQGVELPPLKPLVAAGDPNAPATPAAPAKPDSPPDGLAFSKQVAPILVAKCGQCHVTNTRGELSMANYNALMKGTPEGKVVLAGDDVGSRIIEVITEGDMPRGGLKVTPQELTTLKKWIKDGAKYDLNDPLASLTSFSGAKVGEVAKLEVKAATGKETISFANDIAPVLDEKCSNCHGRTDRPSGRLSMLSFTRLLQGGESGPSLVPGKPAESLLIQKLKGMAGGERMPLRQPPLPDDVIAKIEKWIAEGATFDGPDPQQDIRMVAGLAKAKRSTHEELAAIRGDLASKNWALGMPGIEHEQVETKNFLVIGNLGPETLKQHADAAEAIAPKVAELFGASAGDAPLVKGRITLFVFGQRYDYSEYGKMVEKRDVPNSWRGHWMYSVVDAYGAIIPARRDEYSNDALIAQQIAGVYVASLGNPPTWFAEGAARVAAERLGKDDPRVAEWNTELDAVTKKMSKPDDFLTGMLSPEETNVAAFGFVRFLMSDGKRFGALLKDLSQGQKFEPALQKNFGGTPAQLTDAWSKRGPATKRKRT